jgi:sulfur carrier protein
MSPLITINGEEHSVDEGTTLDIVVAKEAGEEAEHVAVALNDDIIPRGQWSDRSVEEGDDIEIVQPIQGGTE